MKVPYLQAWVNPRGNEMYELTYTYNTDGARIPIKRFPLDALGKKLNEINKGDKNG